MTTYYVDNSAGFDSNPGTIAAPFKTYSKAYSMLGGSGQHAIYIKSGTREDISATVAQRSGLGSTQRSFVGAYGFGPKPILRIVAASTSGVMFHLNGSQYKTMQGIVLDANFLSKFALQVYCDTTAIQDLVFEDCEFINTSSGSATDACVTQSSAPNWPGATGIVFRRCKGAIGGRHGFHNVGNVSIAYERCRAVKNGLSDLGGGHGFSSYAGIINTVTSGWTLVSGTIYSRPLSSPSTHVQRTSGTALALKQNTATPTTPANGEWGQSGGLLYINVGADPSGATIKFNQYAPTVTYKRCLSVDNNSIDGVEGTGFQADDFTGSFTAIQCKAFNNGGPGFFINQGANAKLIACKAHGNGNFGFAGQYAAGVQMDFCTSYGNCVANRSGYDGEVKFQLGSRDVVIRNTVIQKANSTVATASLRFDSSSTVGHQLINSCYWGAPIQGTVTQTNVINQDPMLGPDLRPQNGSPLFGAGLHLGLTRDIDGLQRRRPPTIGCYDLGRMKWTT